MTRFLGFMVILALVAVAVGAQIMIFRPDIELELGRGVRERDNCFEIVGKTRYFTPQDEAVYVVIRATIYCSGRRVQKGILRWYGPPNGTILYHEEKVSGLKCGYIWCIWRSLKIAGTRAASLVGQWKVQFSIPGIGKKSLMFSIIDARAGLVTSPSTPTRHVPIVPRPPEEAGWPEIIAWAKPAVVFIQGETDETDEDGNKLFATGSGVIISPDGYILTAAHLVDFNHGEDRGLSRGVSVVHGQAYKDPSWMGSRG